MSCGSFQLVSGSPAGARAPVRILGLPYPVLSAGGGGLMVYADDGSALASDGWTAYSATVSFIAGVGVPVLAPSLIEWLTPTRSTLIAATVRDPSDPLYPGQTELFAPLRPSATALHPVTGGWLLVGTPTTGHTEPSWLTVAPPALISGSYGPHGASSSRSRPKTAGSATSTAIALTPV